MEILAATDFFTAEVWTKSGLVTYVLFFMHLATRGAHIAGITPKSRLSPFLTSSEKHNKLCLDAIANVG